ncbi:hypothetical protein [Streptomyces formicae]|uniref:Secreted protein n=1 Tax=Streptomyces formicae TaxID=1616117 RepID=A0A291QIV4_9ACTN|nr:hypothetical protein [Streptomyces formicae]ATL31383.1 hypothetical protein KY5_6365c [Streptomyces formicae]
MPVTVLLPILACAAVGHAAVRLVLCALAAHATRRALSPTAVGTGVRAHRLAVLRALLDVLGRR